MQPEETGGIVKKPVELSLTIIFVAFFHDLGSCTIERSKRNLIFKNSVYVQNTKLTKASLRSSSVTEVILLGISNCFFYFKFFETLQISEIRQL